MRTRRLSLGILTLTVAAGALLVGAAGPSLATARPVVSARITAVDAAPRSASVHVSIKATCPTGWDNNYFYHRLIVRQDVTGSDSINAFVNVHGEDVGWACNGEEHAFGLDLVADGLWQVGSARATFDATVTDGTDTAVDFARKNVRIR